MIAFAIGKRFQMTHIISFKEQDSIRPQINLWLVLLLALIGITGGCASGGKNMTKDESACVAIQETDSKEPPQGIYNADDFLTVDCLLPGQDIAIGLYERWTTPPRPAIISGWECKVQGGQYAIGYNNDARQVAVNVWQRCAEQGDKVAQNYLGEIYAKSWGSIKPDFSRAAEWFRKAAEQGYSQAQKNLGVLYEQGLGVPKDPETAFKLYRQAIGEITPVDLDQNTKGKIQELTQKLSATDQNTQILQQQLKATEQRLQQKQDELDKIKKEAASQNTQKQIKALQKEQEAERLSKQKLSEQLSLAQETGETTRGQLSKTETHAALGTKSNMGRYYALIIGINDYQDSIGHLKTPVNDAKQIAAKLHEKYGFETELLTDDTSTKPTRSGIIQKLVELRGKLKEEDNLLIYYAGHGSIHSDRGYWLPQDAKSKDFDDSWIASDTIRGEIQTRTMKAKHVLIVADSCYSAAITTSAITTNPITTAALASSPLITTRAVTTITRSMSSPSPSGRPNLADSSPEAQVGWIKALADRKSRNALTSGGIEPVLDKDTGNGLSIFANAFLEALDKNNDIIDTSQIYLDIRKVVFAKAQQSGGNQVPVYAPIEHTGDNFGEFFFVPRAKQANFQKGMYQIAAAK